MCYQVFQCDHHYWVKEEANECHCLTCCVVLQAVRHLSRHQQEEYRWLKEQLKKKMLLQRKKMQQRPLRTKLPQPPLPPPLSQSPLIPDNAHSTGQGSASPSFTEDSTLSMSPSKETPDEAGNEGTSSSTRAVTWKDMGLLQIQVSNEAALDASNESEDSSYKGRQTRQTRAMEGDSSVDASAIEDEDEETLRMMALLTQKKKKKADNSTLDNQNRRVVIEESKTVEKATHPEARGSEDVLADTRNEDHADEGMKGEWMVLDEVREEGIEAGEEELCAKSELSENETEECGEGVETSDSTESVTRSPERATHEENPEGKPQDPPKVSENSESKSRKSDVINNTVPNTYKAASFEPASEGRSCSIPDEEAKDEPPSSKTDTKQTTKVSSDGEKIEEVIRRIESKTRGVRDKAGNECLPLESTNNNIVTQGNGRQSLSNASSAWITTKQQGTEPPCKAGSIIKADQGVAEVKQAGEPHSSHSEEANTHTLVKPNITSSTTSASVDTQNKSPRGSQSKAATKITAEKRKEGKLMSQRTVISPESSQLMIRKVKVVRPAVDDLQERTEKEASAAITAVSASITTGTASVPQEIEKSPKTLLQLKKLEEEYREKK